MSDGVNGLDAVKLKDGENYNDDVKQSELLKGEVNLRAGSPHNSFPL